jgi:four helix bundle protein
MIKNQITNNKQTIMTEITNSKTFDLEDRTAKFTANVIVFINVCPKTMVNIELTKQLIRSAGSVGANYIEANEALSRKDFGMRAKICRKEAKESRYWLKLIEVSGDEIEKRRQDLVNESTELLKIFSCIVEKLK